MFTKPCTMRSASFGKLERSSSDGDTLPMSSVENPAQLVAHQTELLVLARLFGNLIMSVTCV